MIDHDQESNDSEENKENEVEDSKSVKQSFWKFNKKPITKDNKINELVRIGQDKYLCLDWDKCNYITWNRKKKSFGWFSRNRRDGSDCITAVNLSRKYLKTPFTGKYPEREPKKCFPFILVKESEGI